MSSTESDILFSIDGASATITLNNPERHNALSVPDIRRLEELIAEVNDNQDIRALVLTGTGEKSFCSGVALGEVAQDGWDGNPLSGLTHKLEAVRVPTLCALNGGVYGGAVEIALCCDFRIGVKGMKMFVPPVKLGIHYPPSGLRRLVQHVGLDLAKRAILLAETFTDEDLLHTGFVQELVDPEKLSTRTAELVETLVSFAPMAMQYMKLALNDIADHRLDEEAAHQRMMECWNSEDFQEGIKATSRETPAGVQG